LLKGRDAEKHEKYQLQDPDYSQIPPECMESPSLLSQLWFA
jgi:hypothetical protein